MARKLKTYQTSLGFYDQAIAAPSMKAAPEAWGADSNLFHQGVAKETDDPEIIAATMAKLGVVLGRPVGSNGPFKEHADLPTDLADAEAGAGRARRRANRRSPPLPGSAKSRPARPRWTSSGSRSGVTPSAARGRQQGRNSANGASRRSPRRRPRWTRPGGSTRRGRTRSRPSGPLWTNARKPRRAAGKS